MNIAGRHVQSPAMFLLYCRIGIQAEFLLGLFLCAVAARRGALTRIDPAGTRPVPAGQGADGTAPVFHCGHRPVTSAGLRLLTPQVADVQPERAGDRASVGMASGVVLPGQSCCSRCRDRLP